MARPEKVDVERIIERLIDEAVAEGVLEMDFDDDE